jgi:hypothetical protein
MVNQKITGWCLLALGLVLLTVSGRLDLLVLALPLSLILLGLWMMRCTAKASRKRENVELAR